MQLAITICLALAASAHAHIAAFTKGMYCLNVSLIHIIHVHGVSTEFRLYDWAGIYWKWFKLQRSSPSFVWARIWSVVEWVQASCFPQSKSDINGQCMPLMVWVLYFYSSILPQTLWSATSNRRTQGIFYRCAYPFFILTQQRVADTPCASDLPEAQSSLSSGVIKHSLRCRMMADLWLSGPMARLILTIMFDASQVSWFLLSWFAVDI